MFTVSCCPHCEATDIRQEQRNWWCAKCGREFPDPGTTELIPEVRTNTLADLLGGSA